MKIGWCTPNLAVIKVQIVGLTQGPVLVNMRKVERRKRKAERRKGGKLEANVGSKNRKQNWRMNGTPKVCAPTKIYKDLWVNGLAQGPALLDGKSEAEGGSERSEL